MVSIDVCRDSSCIMLKDAWKEKLEVHAKSPLAIDSVQQLAMALVDDNDFVSNRKR